MAFRFQSGDIKPFYTTGQLFLADRANGRAYAALSLIFSKSIECGRERERVPHPWKKAWIAPALSKKGGRADTSNYRPM